MSRPLVWRFFSSGTAHLATFWQSHSAAVWREEPGKDQKQQCGPRCHPKPRGRQEERGAGTIASGREIHGFSASGMNRETAEAPRRVGNWVDGDTVKQDATGGRGGA